MRRGNAMASTTKTYPSPADKYCLTSIKRNESDANELVRNLSNPAVAHNLRHVHRPYALSDAMWWIETLESEAAASPQRGRLRLYIRDKQTDKLVGNISLWIEPKEGLWVMGYWLAEECWGQGIMTWACGEILERGREEGITKVVGSVRDWNWSSRRVLEKNGFRLRAREDGMTRVEQDNVCQYEIDLAD
jgi:ribosomal-protein-alanine N-acetyltransferase